MQIDFTKFNTAELNRRFRWHDADRGTMTMDQECRRMYMIDAIGEELKRRGEPLPA